MHGPPKWPELPSEKLYYEIRLDHLAEALPKFGMEKSLPLDQTKMELKDYFKFLLFAC